MSAPHLFTAAELGRVLKITPQAVRKRLADIPPKIRVVHGLETAAWDFQDLPPSLRQRLLLAEKEGFHRDFASLVQAPRRAEYHSGIDIAAPEAQEAFALAFELRSALQPVLERGASIRKMAAEAEMRLAPTSLPLLATRTLRRVITRILKNNAGIGNFENIHLYLTEVLTWGGAVVEAGINEGAPFSEATLFESACVDYKELSATHNPRIAMRRVLDWLEKAGMQRSRDALRLRFTRVLERYESGARGQDLVQDRRAEASGRPPMIVLEDEERRSIQRLVVQTGCITTAARMYASRPECREEVAAAILKRRRSKHTLTPALRQQVAVPQAVREFHKSPTRATREGFINPRTLSFIDARGAEQRILPGMFAERDDMSNNFIFWIDWPWGGDPCSDRYKVRIARGQNLLHIDVGSLRFLSFLMLVRLRDSYRADDIWQWVGQGYRDLGIPQIGERWERGIWNAQKLHGLPVEAGHTTQAERLGGIAALGRRIITSQSPTTKIIENRFRYLQRVCTDIPGQIGATRGEMEKVNKLWTQCREGRRDPRQYFPSYEDITKALESKLQFVNAEPVEGAIYKGIPNEIWLREGGDQRMTRLLPEQTYLFHRDRTVVTVTKGHALVRVSNPDGDRQSWYFHHPELWRHEGRRVALYYDKFCPEANPTLVHAEGREINQLIGEATLVDGCPQFALGFDPQSDDMRDVEALARRKDFTGAMRGEYRALGINHTVARGSYVTNGRGRSASIESRQPAGHAEPVNAKLQSREEAAERLKQKAFEKKQAGRISFEDDAALIAGLDLQEIALRAEGVIL